MPKSRLLLPSLLILPLFLFVVGCASQRTEKSGPTRFAKSDPSITVVAAGDIACDPDSRHLHGGKGESGWCQMQATADAIAQIAPKAVLALGDLQYESGKASAFERSYDKTWGRFKSITYPAAGNHEYHQRDAKPYFDYFGDRAGKRGEGWYSFDLGHWHLIALNSNCRHVGGCETGSAQEKWLAGDLEANKGKCTLAYWHAPRFSSGLHGASAETDAFWKDLYAAGADLVLDGHDHDYEVFAPMSPSGKLDPKRGIREFIVGTGGKNRRGFLRGAYAHTNENSEVRTESTFGVLRLDLYDTGYAWRFVPVAGGTFADSGEGTCHSAAATGVHATAALDAAAKQGTTK